MDLNLSQKQAIVCGSTQGIGKAIAVELAQMGASVTLIARNEEKLQETLQELDQTAGQQHYYICADFSNPDDLTTKIKAYVVTKLAVHILVNNTGGPSGGPIIDAGLEEFKKAFSNHLICNHILVQAVVPLMKQAQYGRIINIISTSVKQPLPGLGVSNTIRGAVANWAKTLSLELAQFGITVNNVLPGATVTGRHTSLIQAKAAKTGQTIEQIENEMLASIPAKRFGSSAEVAAAAAFLASPAAGYINGINIPVDGGRTGNL
ncbi:SDR family oxidoreductase [Adhaeribacter radiodurans]|uniref:SDR family oxidoreductase n=1 Tax=Adhaeribacter radiodurans TaxID=2745197 RepID=A0A7L7L1W0_9BACT|nr:SDR family oxidoreductase [Adhaeribacter radiodurans]QMU26777.1 SDR family oxidoreductase [Adhaeribacter radiodurans]